MSNQLLNFYMTFVPFYSGLILVLTADDHNSQRGLCPVPTECPTGTGDHQYECIWEPDNSKFPAITQPHGWP